MFKFQRDFRDTQYWVRMTVSEQNKYTYLVERWQQSQDDLEFGVLGMTIQQLGTIRNQAVNDLSHYEVFILVKYWKTNLPTNNNGDVS